MDVLAFRVSLPEAAGDQASGVLWELGTTGVEVLREAEGRALLLAYFEPREGLSRALDAALSPLGAQVESASVPEGDWLAHFRDAFRGFAVGRFCIAPPWDRPRRLEPNQRLLLVTPGRAFGTGTHESTRLCLLEIEAAFEGANAPRRVLDLGTGSGILAIAAALLGAALVVGVDHDPEALVSARDHAASNQVMLHLLGADGGTALRRGAFDLVLANLTTPLLLAHGADIMNLVAPAGRLVLAGLLHKEVDAVRAAYARLGRALERRDGEWSALCFGRP
jgi:ribosomal protein L11 methyltransferase